MEYPYLEKHLQTLIDKREVLHQQIINRPDSDSLFKEYDQVKELIENGEATKGIELYKTIQKKGKEIDLFYKQLPKIKNKITVLDDQIHEIKCLFIYAGNEKIIREINQIT